MRPRRSGYRAFFAVLPKADLDAVSTELQHEAFVLAAKPFDDDAVFAISSLEWLLHLAHYVDNQALRKPLHTGDTFHVPFKNPREFHTHASQIEVMAAAAIAQRCLEDIYASLEEASSVVPEDMPRNQRFLHLDQTLTLARMAFLTSIDSVPELSIRVKFKRALRQASRRPSSYSSIANYILQQSGTPEIRTRCITFIDQHGWALFSMCAHSLYFCNTLQNPQMQPAWDLFCTLITDNAHSIELFAQTRLNWKEPLVHQDHFTWAELIYRHLYSVLDEEFTFPMGEFFGIDDAKHIYRHGERRKASHPHDWTLDDTTKRVSKPTMSYRPFGLVRETQVNQKKHF